MSILSKLCFWRQPEPVETVTGWVEDLEPRQKETGETVWTLKIRYDTPTGKVFGAYQEVTRGIEYWDVTLSDEAAIALLNAKKAGQSISYLPSALEKISFHSVPWQGFRKVG